MHLLFTLLAAQATVTEQVRSSDFFAATVAEGTVNMTAYAPGTLLVGAAPGAPMNFLVGDNVALYDPLLFPQDGMGTDAGGGGDLWLEANLDLTALGIRFANGLRVELYDAAFNLLYTSSDAGGVSGFPGLPTAGLFLGLISSEPFRYVHLTDWTDNHVNVDDIHLAQAAPMPLLLLGSCPGTVEVYLEGASPFGTIVILTSSSAGTMTIPVGPCAGVPLGLSPRGARALTYTAADSRGTFFRGGLSLAGPICGQAFQVLDQATCRVSNVAFMP
jgi:hypothetical protein